MRARKLLRSIKVQWFRDEDSEDVKLILKSYGGQSEAERRNRAERLAMLPDVEGAPALCRLVRFENSPLLSKQAALLLIGQKLPPKADERSRRIATIKTSVGLSKRPAAHWLHAYIRTLENPHEGTKEWTRLTEAEFQLLDKFPDKTNRTIVRDLLRWQTDLYESLDQHDKAIATIKRSLEVLNDTREEILDAVDWLIDRNAWTMVDELAKRYPAEFEGDAMLTYRLAESQVHQGNQDKADEIAARASKLLAKEPEVHVVAGYTLQDRGFYKWAENEYRYAIKETPEGTLHNIRSRLLLSEMLHDVEKELPAAQALQGIVDAMEKDPAVMELVRSRFQRQPGAIKSRLFYFYSRHHAAKGEHERQIEYLDQAVKNDPTDADVLIAMYRAKPPSAEWRKNVLKQIEAASGSFRDQIRASSQRHAETPIGPQKEWAGRQLAAANNQLAWLVGNTEGDFGEALRCSRQSLELRPDTGGYLDTLGRCYFSVGDLKNAVRSQKRAVELDPYSQQIRRQLELFEKALAAKETEN
ncbi:MAG: hypothetical protein IH991_17225, partial [Planctomycetes bacterium]|nr:hypothetical protein [Planctomycetota bacterium]